MLAEVCRWSWGKNLTVGSNFRFQLSPSLPHSGVPFPTRAPSMNRFLSFPLSSFFFFSSILPKRSSLRYDALTVVPGTLTGTLTGTQLINFPQHSVVASVASIASMQLTVITHKTSRNITRVRNCSQITHFCTLSWSCSDQRDGHEAVLATESAMRSFMVSVTSSEQMSEVSEIVQSSEIL